MEDKGAEIFLPELNMSLESLRLHLLSNYNIKIEEMNHKMQTGGTADSAMSNDPMIGGTMASSMKNGGGVDVKIPPQGTMISRDKKNKLDYKKVGNNYEFIVYEVEPNPVENYSRTSFKKKSNGVVTMNYNQFINYIYSEGYVDDKMAKGGKISVGDFVKVKPMYGNIYGEVTFSNDNIIVIKNSIGKTFMFHPQDLIKSMGKGGNIEMGDMVNITDDKSMFTGKSGVVLSQLTPKTVIVKILVDGNERNVVVRKSGLVKVDSLEEGGIMTADEVYSYDTQDSEFMAEGGKANESNFGKPGTGFDNPKYNSKKSTISEFYGNKAVSLTPFSDMRMLGANIKIERNSDNTYSWVAYDNKGMPFKKGQKFQSYDEAIVDFQNTKFESGGGVGNNQLNLVFSRRDVFEKAKDFYENESGFYPAQVNDEFRTFVFDIENNEADVTEYYLDQELQETDLDGYYFELADKYGKGGGVSKFFSKAKELGKKGYEKSKVYTKEKVKEQKRKIAVDVINDTDNRTSGKANKDTLDKARQLVIRNYSKGGSISDLESQVNALYSKSGFINTDFNWRLKLLEMLQDQSGEAYDIYQKLSKQQKDDVLQEQFEVDNDMGSDGDGDIKTSKENLMAILSDAKNGKKYAEGGEVDKDYPFEYKGYKYNVLDTNGMINDRGQKLYSIKIKDHGNDTLRASNIELAKKYAIIELDKIIEEENTYAKGGGVGKATSAQKRKIGKVMREWKEGELNIGKSDKKVKSQKQAVAIALSEAGLSKMQEGGKLKNLESLSNEDLSKLLNIIASSPNPNLDFITQIGEESKKRKDKKAQSGKMMGWKHKRK